MEDLLVRLVEAPTVLGAEEAGPGGDGGGVRATAGWSRSTSRSTRTRCAPTDGASPFSWDVSGKRNVVATWRGPAAAAR